MPHRLPPTVAASQLLDALIRLQHDARLRDLLGPNPLEGLVVRADRDALAVDLAEPPDDASPEAATIRDALQDAFARALEPAAPAPPSSDPRARSRQPRAADPNPHIIAARAHLEAGNPGRALEVVEAALPRWPQNVDLHTFHALTLATLGRAADALDAYREVIRLDPRSGFAYTGASELCASLGRWPDALAYAKQALDLDPRDALCMRVLALANEHLGLYREAAEAMRSALTLEPQLAGGKQDLERIERGLAEDVEIDFSAPAAAPQSVPQPPPATRQEAYPPIDVSFEAEAPASAKPEPRGEPPAPSGDARWGTAAHRTPEAQARQCPKCATANPARVVFCVRCGERLGDQ